MANLKTIETNNGDKIIFNKKQLLGICGTIFSAGDPNEQAVFARNHYIDVWNEKTKSFNKIIIPDRDLTKVYKIISSVLHNVQR